MADLVEKIRDVVGRRFGNDADAVKGFDEIAVLLAEPTDEPSAPVYGVEVTRQSGRIEVMNITDDPRWAETFRRMTSTLIGRASPHDGVAAVRLVTARPVWEAYEPEAKS